jgi:PAS domain S-box-containing protein
MAIPNAKPLKERVLDVTKTERIKVLHVDDDPAFLEVAKQCLEMQGEIEVDTASSVTEALEKLKQTNYGAIVSDYQMPGKDGLQFLKELRDMENSLPFIVFTGKGREEIAIKALNLGADHYINKLGDPETVYGELLHSIRKAAKEKHDEEQLLYQAQLMQNVDEAIIASDETFTLTSWNQGAERTYGWKANEVIGRFDQDVLQPEFVGIDRSQAIQKLRETGRFSGEVVQLHRSGNRINIETNAMVIRGRNNRVIGYVSVNRDITERKKAEEAAKESEARFHCLVEDAFVSIATTDTKGRLTYVNQATADMLGYSRSEMIGQPFASFLHPGDKGKIMRLFLKSVILRMSPRVIEYRLVHKDGHILNMMSKPTKLTVEGKTIGFQAISADITDRKKMENMVRENQEKFEKLFMGNPEASVYLNTQSQIVDANPRFATLFGYSIDEIKGKHINDVVVPEDMMEEGRRLDEDAIKGYVYHDTVRKRKDGSLVPVSVSAAPLMIKGELIGYVGVYKDISDLRKTEAELIESRKHFRSLFNLIADPVAIVDEKGQVLEITEKVEEVIGFKKEEVIGKNFLRIGFATAKTKAIMLKSLAKRMMGMQVNPYEVEILARGGRKLQYEINAARIDYKGKPADLVVFRDISERKKLEEKLRVVGGLTRHDVRNKLTTVSMNTYLLRKKLAGNPEAMQQLETIETAITNVETIFEFARTYEKLGVEQLTYTDVRKVFDEAISLFSDLKGVRTVNECQGLTVLADSLLRQLLYNLIDNSLKYGEKIQQIRAYYRTSSIDQLELVYEDDGVGTPDNMRGNLFREGFTSGKGTGYGLFMAKRICEVYGWTIQETGIRGKGAQFTIAIPSKNQKGETLYKIRG